MPKYICLFLLHCYTITGFTQHNYDRAPLYHDSLRNDPYIQEVQHKLDSIHKLLRSKQVRYDTLELSVVYTSKTTDGRYIVQNPYAGGRAFGEHVLSDTVVEPIDTVARMPAYVMSYQGEVLCISLGSPPFLSDSISQLLYEEFQPFTLPILYFDRSSLIYSSHSCSDPSMFVGSCGGTSSTYSNYFRNNRYYSTLIGGKTYYCGCGYNYIVSEQIVDEWIKQLPALLNKE